MSELIHQNARIWVIMFCVVFKMWSSISLILLCQATLANDGNHVGTRTEPHIAWLFPKHPLFHFASVFHFTPAYPIWSNSIQGATQEPFWTTSGYYCSYGTNQILQKDFCNIWAVKEKSYLNVDLNFIAKWLFHSPSVLLLPSTI